MARETGVNENTLYSWVKKFNQQPEVKAAQTFSSPDAELKALQKQLRDLEEENQKVLQTHLEFKLRYGSVKITITLNKRGIKVASVQSLVS